MNKAFIDSLIEKYKDPALSYYQDEEYLDIKWVKQYGKGWYGISLGPGLPKSWYNIIDDVLLELLLEDPVFEIHQIKIKFGGLRFYVNGEFGEETLSTIGYLESKLYSKELVY